MVERKLVKTKIMAFIRVHLRNLLRKSALVTFSTNQEKLVQDIKDTALIRVLLLNHYLPCTLPHFSVIRLNRYCSSKYDVPQKHNNYNQNITQQ